MSSCETMKVGEVYVCPKCGLELEVKKTCNCADDDSCQPHVHDGLCCDFQCCGEKLILKK